MLLQPPPIETTTGPVDTKIHLRISTGCLRSYVSLTRTQWTRILRHHKDGSERTYLALGHSCCVLSNSITERPRSVLVSPHHSSNAQKAEAFAQISLICAETTAAKLGVCVRTYAVKLLQTSGLFMQERQRKLRKQSIAMSSALQT